MGLIILAVVRLHNVSVPVLEPRGIVAHKERNLILVAVGLCAVVVIPVYAMLIGFAWKYRRRITAGDGGKPRWIVSAQTFENGVAGDAAGQRWEQKEMAPAMGGRADKAR